MEALGGAFFKPNILFLTLPTSPDQDLEDELQDIIRKAALNKVGVMLLVNHPRAHLGRRQAINVWVDDRSPDWDLTMELGNLDLALLIAYKLKRNWQGSLNLITAVKESVYIRPAREFLDNLTELARLPRTETLILQGDSIENYVEAIPVVLAGVLVVNILLYFNLFDIISRFTAPIISGLFGLPNESIIALMIGLFRKDVAVGMLAPLSLSAGQLVVGSVVLAMFFPCIATFAVLAKELGFRRLMASAGLPRSRVDASGLNL